jgi:hypothetical protein
VFFKHSVAEVIDFHLPSTFHADAFQSKVNTANASKQ